MSLLNRHIIGQFFTRFGAALFGLIVGILISRELGTEGKGIHGLFIASVALIHLSGNWFGGASLVYLVPRHPIPALLRMSTLWTSLGAVISWGILFLIGLIPEGYEWQVFLASLLFIWWNNLANILLGGENTTAFNTLQLLHPGIVTLLLLAGFRWVGAEFGIFANAYILAQALTLLLAIWYMREPIRQVESGKDPVLFKVFLRHGFYVQLSNLTQFFNYRILFFLIDSHFGRSFLGVYSNALSLAESIWMITRSISTVQYAKISNSTDRLANRDLTRHYGRLSILVSAVCLFFLLLLPDRFFVWLFGPGFAGIHHVLLWLAPAVLSMSFGNIFAHYFAGIGKNQFTFRGSLINLVILTVSFFLLLPTLGTDAAALSSSIAFTASMIYLVLMFRFNKSV